MMDAFKWAPKGSGTWLSNRNKSPGMAKLRKNQAYAHEVAVKLIKEKRQEMEDGIPRKDLLSLLGSSSISFVQRSNSTTFRSSVKANSALQPDWRLNDDEIIPQVL